MMAAQTSSRLPPSLLGLPAAASGWVVAAMRKQPHDHDHAMPEREGEEKVKGKTLGKAAQNLLMALKAYQ